MSRQQMSRIAVVRRHAIQALGQLEATPELAVNRMMEPEALENGV
jgi:hypothetical protein